MNPQMPPLPPSEPLDEEERALARALRGLPSAMPPPELDARILGASRRAIAIAPKARAHRRGWVWGLSTAAAAVLAAGVLLKLHTEGRDQVGAPSEAPANAQPAAAKSAAQPNAPTNALGPAEETSVDMESAQSAAANVKSNETQARASNPVAAIMPPPPKQEATSERDEMKAAKFATPQSSASGTVAPADKAASGGQPAPSNAAPQPFPAAPAAAPRAVPVAPPERETSSGFATPAVTDQAGFLSKAPAPAPAPPPPAVTTAISQPSSPASAAAEPAQMQQSQKAGDARKDAALERVEVTGSRLKASDSKALPAIDDDATLPPTQWIGRIRARMDAGDSAGARESLRRYAAHYPDAWIPPDLAPLRK
jgi:hypothetical protein